MTDREISWKAVADFSSLIAQSKAAQKSLKDLKDEQHNLATSFDEDSKRITTASKDQNKSIDDTVKSYREASKASKDSADGAVRDSKRKGDSYKAEANVLENIKRAHRELDVAEKKRADMGQRLFTIQNALAAASQDVADATERKTKATNDSGRASRDAIKAEQNLISARRSQQRISSAGAQAESDRTKAIKEAAAEEQKAALAEKALETARTASARATREIEAAQLRSTRARRDDVSTTSGAVAATRSVTGATRESTAATRDETAELVRNSNTKKTFLQFLQNIQSAQHGYKGTIESVTAAQTSHARALSRSLAASRELEKAESDLNNARRTMASSEAAVADGEARVGEARTILSHATEDVNKAEAELTAVRASAGAGSREAVQAEQNLNAARSSYTRISSTVSSIDRDIAVARNEGARANQVIESSEARINNARQRSQLTGAALVRATTRLNGEMNASQSIVKQVGNAFSSLSSIFSGMSSGFKDLMGMFGRMALILLPQLLPLVGALAGGFVQLTSSFVPMVGLLGALPGMLLGAVTGFAALKGAFGGVSKALKAYSTEQAKAGVDGTKAANAAKKNAKAIADAQRAVSDAKKNAAQANKDASQKVVKAEADAADANKSAAADVKQAEADKIKAFKDAASRVADAVQSAKDSVASANANVIESEKNLISAQADSKKAQQALNDVRKDAIRELEDMQKAARDASFSERDATLNLIDARNALAKVKEDPTASDSEVAKAQLQYDEAQARLSDAEQAKKDAVAANAEAQSKGITGTKAYTNAQDAAAAAAEKVAQAQQALVKSQQEQTRAVQDAAKSIAKAEADAADQRKSATKSVADAQKKQAKTQKDGIASIVAARQAQAKTEAQGAESIRKAQESVATAMENAAEATRAASSSANAYQAALNKLSPSQRQFVQFLIGLKPKLDQLKETAAKNMLPGVEAGIRGAMPLFPAFNRSVGNTAKAFGDASSSIGKTLGSGEGFGAMKRVFKANDDAVKEAAGSSGHYTIALVRIMDAARPLVKWIGHLVATFGNYLDNATKVNKENGHLSGFFDSAKSSAATFGYIVKNLGGIIWGLFKAAKGTGDELNSNFNKHLKDMNEQVNSQDGQKKLKKWFEDIKPVVQATGRVFTNLARGIGSLTGGKNDKQGKGLKNLADMLNGLANGVGPDSPLIKFFGKLNESGAQKQTFDAIGGLFKSITDFGASKGGQTVLATMATELGLVADALGKIMSNQVGAAILTSLMVAAATIKVAKFIGASTGISSVAGMAKNAAAKRKAQGKRSWTNRATGGRIGRGGSGGTGSVAGDVASTEAQAESAGAAVSRGMEAGINSNSAEVLRSIDLMTDGIISHIRTNLEIHSPSKVTTRLGEDTALGFINGLQGENKQASTAAESLETATLKSLSDADSKMRLKGEEAGRAYSQGLKSTSSSAMVSPGVVAGGKAAKPKSGPMPPVATPRGNRGMAVRGAIGSAGGAAMMGSMFLPGKAGEIAGQAGMLAMMISMLPKLETVTKTIKAITSALKLQTVAQKLGAVAAKIYAAGQWLVNIAMEANPIGLIIIGLIALGVAFYVLWKKSETFRDIVTGAWNAIKAAAVAVFDWFKKIGSTIFDALKTAAESVFGWLKKNWKLILAILTAPFGGMVVYLTIKFWPQIIGFLNKLWGWVKGAFKKLWSGVKAVFMAPFDAAKALINQFTDSKSGVRKILTAVWNWVSGTFRKLWSGLKSVLLAPLDLAKTLINQIFDSKSGFRHILSSVWSWVTGTFRKTWSGLKSLITSPITDAKNAISTLLGKGKGGLQTVFTKALDGIKTIWNGLQSIALKPINFMRTKVFKGLADAYNWVVDKIPGAGSLKINTKASQFQPLKLAQGGRVHGNSPTPVADNVPAMLTAGEWVQPVSTVKHYGSGVMEALRKRQIPKEALSRFASGGIAEGREASVLTANKRKKRLLTAHLRDGGMAGSSGYSLGSMGGAATLSNYYDSTAVGHEHATGSGAKVGGGGGSWGLGVTTKGASVPYRPGMHSALVRYGKTLRSRGMSILENPAFGAVHPVHMGGSLHYVGEAMDVSGGPGWPGSGNKVYSEALAKGFAAIWKSAGHYDHVHIDTGLYKEYNNKTSMIGSNYSIGTGELGSSDEGNWFTNTFSSLKDLLGGLNPISKLKSGISAVKSVADNSGIGKLLGKLAAAPLNLAVSALKSAFFGSDSYEGADVNNPAGAESVARWSPTVKKALKMLGIPQKPEYVKNWLTQIGWESSGNPSAIQGDIGDINNRTGQLARGLVQVVPGTFKAYHLKGHDNIFSALDNLLAGMRYAKSVYGLSGFSNFIGKGSKHGYSEGGFTGSGYKYEPAGVVHRGEVVWSQQDVAAHGGAHKVDSMRKHRGSKVAGYATGGIVAPPDGKAIRGIQPGLHMMAWKMIRQLFHLPTVRGMKSPWADGWDSSVTKAFTKANYTVPDLSTITKALDVSKYLSPVVNMFRHTQSRLPGKTGMERYATVGPTNYKQHPSLTRAVQKVIGIKDDGVWGSKMSKSYMQWRADKGLPSRSHGRSHNYVTTPDWKWLAEERYPSSYGAKNRYTDKNYKGVRLEDIANKYGISMWQAAALFQGKNKDYISKHTLKATSHLAQFDADQMSGSTSWLNGNMIKSYQAMFGVHQDGTWATGMADWSTYAMRKQMGKKTDSIFPPWWSLDPLQKAIEDQNKNNADQKEFLKDLDILSGWGFGNLVDKLQSDGPTDGLPVARIAVKNQALAKQYDDQLKEQASLDSTGTEDFTKFVATVMAPGVQMGIRSIAQTLGIADFAVVDMYDKLIKSGRLKKGERTARLDKETTQFKSGLFYAATGGRVPGTGTGDTVPAMLTPGEFVLKKAAVKAIGMENLYNLNNMQKFATGGQVYSFNDSSRGFGTRMPDFTGVNIFSKRLLKGDTTTSDRKTLDDDKKVVYNYTTINNPKAEKSTADINRLLRKKAALGFMAVAADTTKVNN